MMEFIGLIWNQLILGPMVNSLVFLYVIFFDNFGLSVLLFTVIIRLITLPLTLKQIRLTRGMSQLQPLVKELQRKYADDKARLSKETMALYKTQGVSPLGCLGPMFIQMPIWIGLYQGIIQTLPSQPERLIGLSQKLYSWLPLVNEAVPLNSKFLWLDLAMGPGEQSDFLLPALVGLSMWAVQKMSTVPSADARQAQTNQMMLWMMPLMLTFFSFQLPSGLALYWVASNLIQMGIQYFITGWGNLLPSRKTEPTPQTPTDQPVKEIVQNGNSGSDGKNRGGSGRNRPGTARRRARPGRSRRNQSR
jgi:YidC/Oxa1 family membrane protein insertase